MKEKNVNNTPISFRQSIRGVWYCNGFCIKDTKQLKEQLSLAEEDMKIIEQFLEKQNERTKSIQIKNIKD